MPYGTIKVDTITFTAGGVDTSVSISGLVQNPTFTGNITSTGTISGNIIQGGTTVSGATVTGTTANFVTVSGTTVTGGTARFTTLTGVSGVFTGSVSGVTLLTSTGVFASGTAAAPSITFNGDLDTGLFTGAANTVGIAANGAAVLTVSGTNVGIGTANPLEKFHVSGGPLLVAGELQGVRASSTALDYSSNSTRLIAMGPDVSTTSPILFLNGTSSSVTEKARLDSSGRLLIGATNARTLTTGGAGGNHKLQVETAGATSVFTTASIYSNSDVAALGAFFELGRSKGTALGAVTAVASGDLLGEIRFAGTDGSSSAQSSSIQGIVDAAVSSGKIAGRLAFLTTTDGGTSPTVKMTIKNDGNIGIGTTSPGIIAGLSKYLTLSATGSSEAPGFEIVGNRNSSSSTTGRISFINVATGNNEIARINCQTSSSGPLTEGVLVFSTSGTSRLIIDAGGNVAIGTTTADTTLTVKGTDAAIRVQPSNVANAQIFLRHGSLANNSGLEADNTGALAFYANGSERSRIDSSGRLLVGTSSARTAWDNTIIGSNLIQVERGIDGGNTSISICANAGTSSPTDTGAFLYLGKTRGTTAGSTTAVASADCLGRVSFQGSDGTDQVEAARVEAFVDGTPGANDMPGRLVFLTTADGASSPTERMRITSNGNFFVGGSSNKIDSTTSQEIQLHSYLTLGQFASGSCPGYLGWNITATSSAGTYKARTSGDRSSVLTLNSGGDLFYSAATTTQTAGVNLTNFGERVRFLAAGGITFNGDTADTNALDDYEEGTFNPTIVGTSTTGTVTYTSQQGTYTKVGRVVHIQIYVDWNSGTGSGNLRVSGLPFTAAGSAVYPAMAIGECSNIALSASHILTARVTPSTANIDCAQYPAGGGTNAGTLYDAAGYIVMGGSYIV